jgi:hypothetical protein
MLNLDKLFDEYEAPAGHFERCVEAAKRFRCDGLPPQRDSRLAIFFMVRSDALTVAGPELGRPALGVTKTLREATEAACRAYAESGRMLDAALAYAACGFPVFPLTKDKTPVPKRDKDANGKPIPGTGGFKKATCDPVQINAWWKGREHLIGLPMGAVSGVWCLDVDTSEDHADGVAEWKEIAAEHEPIVTREHRSATGGPHLIFKWDAERPLGCSSGDLPDGIEVKGGGYIVVPPSRRKGRSYSVFNDIDPADAPRWLTDLIGRPHFHEYVGWETTADFDEVADAMSCIPNPDEAWHEWKSMAMRLYAALGDEGFALFDAWSMKSIKYHGGSLRAWEEVQGSPPSRTGVDKIFKIAREHGWVRKAEPTYSPAEELRDIDAARKEMHSIVREFFKWVARPEDESNVFIEAGLETARDPEGPLVWAVLGPTGIGKTRITIEELATLLRKLSALGTVMYMVPTHELGKDIVELFAAAGLTAKVYRGREAINPDTLDAKLDPKDPQQERMCVNLEQVRLAYEAGVDVSTSCCLRKAKKGERERRCKFYDVCAWQRHLLGDRPDVWVAAHEMLFHPQKAFGKNKDIAAVIVDESFWQDGLRIQEHGVALSEMESSFPECKDDCAELEQLRGLLVKALRRQPHVGGVERQYLVGKDFFDNVTPEDCTRAISLEYKMVERVEMHPGMSARDLKRLTRDVPAFRRAKQMAAIWGAARQLLNRDDIEVSGHLVLEENKDGERFALYRGVASVCEQYLAPTLLMDATSPDDKVLQAYFPQVERVADIKVAMPHVYIRQVLEAPVSKKRLLDGLTERGENTTNRGNRRAIRRYILRRWVETGRQPTLVVCQQKYEDWLRGIGLPGNIAIEHFNNIEGLDRYKHVRLLITVGRTIPAPATIETYAGALTGVQPVGANNEKMDWYERVVRGIHLVDGSGVAVDCDMHPDPTAEAVRRQICEAQLIQSIGRGRGVNRTAETPLDVDIVSNVVLPLVVNEVSHWRAPSETIETWAEDGIVLTSPVDMVKARPDLWPNTRAADRTLETFFHRTLSPCSGAEAGTSRQSPVEYYTGLCRDVRPLRYQLRGPKQNRRAAVYDPAVLPDPRTWLEKRLGPLAFFELVEKE